jgi:hypothetical protein
MLLCTTAFNSQSPKAEAASEEELSAERQGKLARAKATVRRVHNRHVAETSAFYKLKSKDIHGEPVGFAQFKGHVLLITNVASF